jgi:hypothetical protein
MQALVVLSINIAPEVLGVLFVFLLIIFILFLSYIILISGNMDEENDRSIGSGPLDYDLDMDNEVQEPGCGEIVFIYNSPVMILIYFYYLMLTF